MMTINKELDRYLTLLRNKIRERGFTQLDVQEALSWGRSYISQLLTKQKSLRVEQVLLILDVIGVDPAEFFAELYYFPGTSARNTGWNAPESESPPEGSFEEMKSLVRGLVWLLIDKEMIDVDELATSVRKRKVDPVGDFDPDNDLTN